MTGSWMRAGAAAAVAAGLGFGPAAAQPAATRAEIFQRLIDCRKLGDDAQRLACYDAQAAAVDQAEAKGDIVVVDRQQADQVRRQAFGFTLPSLSLFDRGEAPEKIDSVTGVVKSARMGGDGKWVVELQDGAVWAQTDSERLMRDPAPGMEAKIRRAAMGSYMMNLGGQRAVRARRVE
ncbi:MAG: hypothetical protein ACK4YQ_14155 [Phenylobacterium sp.]|uniref:hypothetical protein n=1 Tax=Phenylobacterium sp. TaxID=1871053 RepID=UPI00391AFE0E